MNSAPMISQVLALAVAVLLGTATPASTAQSGPPAGFDPIQPGLWETRVQVEGSGVANPAARSRELRREMESMMSGPQLEELRRQMESMPPEQRRQMQAMLEQQPSAMTGGDRYCVTPEEASRGLEALGADEEDEDCETVYGKRQGQRLPFTLRCNEPPSEGKGELVFESRRAISMDMRMTIREPGQPPRQMRMQSTHRWIADDCGDLKE